MVWKKEKPKLNRVIVVTSYRKHGNGAVGSGRKNETGKRGEVSQIAEDGGRLMILKVEAPTLKALSIKLRGFGGVPEHVSINKKGETFF